LHDCVARNAEGELYQKLIKRRRPNEARTFAADRSKIELLVFQQFDLSKLTTTNIVRLREQEKSLEKFRKEMTTVAASIRAMREESQFKKRLKERIGSIIADWEKSKAKPGSYAKEFFVGSEKPAGEFLKKIAEQTAGPVVTGAIVGGLTTGAILGAAAGLGVALVIHAASSVRAVHQKEKDSPYRFLTLLEKTGIAFTAGC
jgi:hypothetical protein